MKLGIGNILIAWDNMTWNKNLTSKQKAELKTELATALNKIEVETDEATAQTILKLFHE